MQEEQPQSQAPQPGWQYTPEGPAIPPEPGHAHTDSVSWTASEFISHQKDISWYALFAVASAAFIALAYLLTQDKITAVAITVTIISFAVFATRQPRTLAYRVDSSGITIGDKLYDYGLFKSFSVIEEDAIRSIMLMPLKRFMPALSIYMDPADEQRIVDVLALHLPEEQRKQDIVDRLMRRIRF